MGICKLSHLMEILNAETKDGVSIWKHDRRAVYQYSER